MLYKYISSSRGHKSTCISQEDFPNNAKWTRCKYPKWEVVLVIRIFSAALHIHECHNEMSSSCMYPVTGWGMSHDILLW